MLAAIFPAGIQQRKGAFDLVVWHMLFLFLVFRRGRIRVFSFRADGFKAIFAEVQLEENFLEELTLIKRLKVLVYGGQYTNQTTQSIRAALQGLLLLSLNGR